MGRAFVVPAALTQDQQRMLVLVGAALIQAAQQLRLVDADDTIRHQPSQHLGEAELMVRYGARFTGAGHADSIANATRRAGAGSLFPGSTAYSTIFIGYSMPGSLPIPAKRYQNPLHRSVTPRCPMSFEENLRTLRLARGLTQPLLAEKTGIEQSYLSKLENGRSHPSDEVLGRLAQALEVKPETLQQNGDETEDGRRRWMRVGISAASVVVLAAVFLLG